MSLRCIVFDADGTVRSTTVAGHYFPRRPNEWELRPNVRERFAQIDWSEVGFGVASNQAGVALGFLSELMAHQLLVDMSREAFSLVPAMASVWTPQVSKPFIQLCPHDPRGMCACRKPMPGMLTRIMAYYDVRPAETLFVGNADTDRAAAQNAGCMYQDESVFFELNEARRIRMGGTA